MRRVVEWRLRDHPRGLGRPTPGPGAHPEIQRRPLLLYKGRCQPMTDQVLRNQRAITAHFSSNRLLLFAFVCGEWDNKCLGSHYSTVQCQKPVTTHLNIKQSLASSFAEKYICLPNIRLPNVGSMLARRRRRRANIELTLVKHLVFAGIYKYVSTLWTYTLLCKSKRQYLFTCKVFRYCFLSLHGSAVE